MKGLPWRGTIYSVGFYGNIGINFSQYAPIEATQIHLYALMDYIEVIFVAFDHNLLCNEIAPYTMIFLRIGISLHE